MILMNVYYRGLSGITLYILFLETVLDNIHDLVRFLRFPALIFGVL